MGIFRTFNNIRSISWNKRYIIVVDDALVGAIYLEVVGNKLDRASIVVM